MDDVAYRLLYETELNHWWDKVRRMIVLKLIKKYSNSSKLTILDLGCGTGVMAKEAESLGEYHGIDVSEQAINFCKTRGVKNVKQGDALHIPHNDNQFDVVLLLDAIEHVEDDLGVMAEASRVLRPGGIVIITAPAYKFLWGPSDEVFHHYRRYRLGELRRKLEQKNFSVVKHSYFNTLLFLPIAVIKLVVKFFCSSISENDISRQIVNNNWILNKILYYIFYLESLFLPYVSFPFGVSVLAVGRK